MTSAAASGFNPTGVPLPDGASAALAGDALAQLRGGSAQRLELLLSLASQPEWIAAKSRPWATAAQLLGLGNRELELLCWQLAAELRAQGFTWQRIAAHPAMKLKQDTLEKRHESARLPCGMSFIGMVSAYQRAYRAEAERLARESGADDARETHALARRMRSFLGLLLDDLESFRADPPLGCWEQQTEIRFGDLLPDGSIELKTLPEDKRKRVTPKFFSFLNLELETATKTLKAVDSVLSTNTEASADELDENPQLTLDALRDKLLASRERLQQVLNPPAEHAVPRRLARA